MTMRETLDNLKAKVSWSYIPFGKHGGEARQEEYPEGDPRRVKREGNA